MGISATAPAGVHRNAEGGLIGYRVRDDGGNRLGLWLLVLPS
jgi:hypothetical protein